MKKLFFCVSCQLDRPIEQLSFTHPKNKSRRLKACCERAANRIRLGRVAKS
jgi:hypothetical protein